VTTGSERAPELVAAVDDRRERDSCSFDPRPCCGGALDVHRDGHEPERVAEPFADPLPPGQLLSTQSPRRPGEEEQTSVVRGAEVEVAAVERRQRESG